MTFFIKKFFLISSIIIVIVTIFVIMIIFVLNERSSLNERSNKKFEDLIEGKTKDYGTPLNITIPNKCNNEWNFYFKDNKLFLEDILIDGVDPASFKRITEHYYKDKNNIIYLVAFVPISPWHDPKPDCSFFSVKKHIVEGGIDEATFRVVNNIYAVDSKNTYKEGKKIVKWDPNDCKYYETGLSYYPSEKIQKRECNYDLAVLYKDDSLCNNIDSDSIDSRNSCRHTVALASMNPNVCKKIDDDSKRNQCYLEVAKQFKDMSLCENIKDNRRNWCINDIAVLLKNKNLCEIIPINNDKYCTSYEKQKMEWCQPGTMRSWCFNNVNKVSQ